MDNANSGCHSTTMAIKVILSVFSLNFFVSAPAATSLARSLTHFIDPLRFCANANEIHQMQFVCIFVNDSVEQNYKCKKSNIL